MEASVIVLPHMAQWQKKEMEKAKKSFDRFEPVAGSSDEFVFDNARDFVEFSSVVKSIERLAGNKSLPLLARSLFMQIFCEFDAFMGVMLKQIYMKNFDLMRGISREISLVDLLSFGDIQSASLAMLEKEIDSIRRDSYIDQFGNLEKKFSLQLKKFPEWKKFVDFSQRRNLFAHNDGVVSEQYLSICRREECGIDKGLSVGDQLVIKPADLFGALRVMSKVGYMLCHTLWSKIFPKETDEVHKSLNDILYETLEDKHWAIAADFGEFALSEPMTRKCAEIDLRIRIVNAAIANKFGGDQDGAKALLDSQDWSASYRDFKLAILILNDDFDGAIELMRKIGKSGELLNQRSYHTWPLFEKFREREDFYAIYKEIYGEPFESDSPDVKGKLDPNVSRKKMAVRHKASSVSTSDAEGLRHASASGKAVRKRTKLKTANKGGVA